MYRFKMCPSRHTYTDSEPIQSGDIAAEGDYPRPIDNSGAKDHDLPVALPGMAPTKPWKLGGEVGGRSGGPTALKGGFVKGVQKLVGNN